MQTQTAPPSSSPSTSNGPYETLNDAATAAEPMMREARVRWEAQFEPGTRRSGDPGQVLATTRLAYLERACKDAGVELGAFERQRLLWLAGGEQETFQLIIGLVARAGKVGGR